jgi:hypothetical protein
MNANGTMKLNKIKHINVIFNKNFAKQGIEITKTNGFLYYNTPETSYCFSFDRMVLKIGKKKGKIYHADEAVYIFSIPIFISLYNADVVDTDHKAHQKFRNLLSKISKNNANLKKMHFCAVFNDNYERIEMLDIVKNILPSFKNVESVSIITKEISLETVKLIKRISH